MRLVRFVKMWSPYNSGERATFDPANASALVSAGVAEYADGATIPEAAPKADHAQTPSPPAVTGAASGLLSIQQDGTPVAIPLPPVDPAAEAEAVRADSVSRTDRKHKRDRR